VHLVPDVQEAQNAQDAGEHRSAFRDPLLWFWLLSLPVGFQLWYWSTQLGAGDRSPEEVSSGALMALGVTTLITLIIPWSVRELYRRRSHS
jgi:hypothetical protein